MYVQHDNIVIVVNIIIIFTINIHPRHDSSLARLFVIAIVAAALLMWTYITQSYKHSNFLLANDQ